jgi:hypothetical protein
MIKRVFISLVILVGFSALGFAEISLENFSLAGYLKQKPLLV